MNACGKQNQLYVIQIPKKTIHSTKEYKKHVIMLCVVILRILQRTMPMNRYGSKINDM